MTVPVAAPGKAPAPKGKAAPQVVTRPFVAGTRRADTIDYDQTKTLTAGTQDMPAYQVAPDGYWKGSFLLVEAVTAGNAAATAFTADGPMNVIDTINVSDTNSKPIFGPMNGHDWYECLKHGGYSFVDDIKQSPIYSATTGAGSTGGSFTFVLWLPIEIVERDGLGSLTNKSSAATFNIGLRLAAIATVYSVAPTNPASVRCRWQLVGWMDPNDKDMRGNPVAQNPPANNSTQYWQKQTYALQAGAYNFRLQGIDSLVRCMLFILMDNTNSRQQGDADFPDPWVMQYETVQPVNRIRNIWRHMIGKDFGYINTVETPGGRDYGVYPENFHKDFSLKPGGETRLGYLPVSSSTVMALNGQIGGSGAHTLIVLVNKIVPAGGDPLALTGR